MKKNWMAITIVAVAATLLQAGSAMTQAPSPAPITIHGIVTTADGKPAPDVTLYLLNLPGSGYPSDMGLRGMVSTDAKGRFVWSVPSDMVDDVKASLTSQIDWRSTLPAYWLPTDASWAVTPEVPPVSSWNSQQMQEQDINQLYQDATIKCTTIYPKAWNDPELSVVLPSVGAGTIALQIRDPNGKPLSRRMVQIHNAPDYFFPQGMLVYSSKTDGSGRLVLPWPAGLCRLAISVPGVGFGATGVLDVQTNRLISPVVPPLAPWASVAGSVAPELLHPGETVQLQDWENYPFPPLPSGPVDAQGQFLLSDVPPGDYSIKLLGPAGAKIILAKPESLVCIPGERISGARLSLPAPLPAIPSGPLPPVPAFRFGVNSNLPSVLSGHVTTTDGKPVAGASVWAVYAVSDFNAVSTISETTTDASGAYMFNDLRPGLYGASVFAAAPGYPIADADAAENLSSSTSDGSPSVFTCDLVLPNAHTGLTVHVLQDGKPAGAGVMVHAIPESGDAMSTLMSFESNDAAGLQQCLAPSVQTDTTGTATFTDLTPGLWNVTGGTVKPDSQSFQAKGVPVPLDSSTTITVNLIPAAVVPTFKPEWPDGSAWTGTDYSYSMGIGSGPLSSGVGGNGGVDGDVPLSESDSGLYQVKPILRHGSSQGFYGQPEPYDGATGLLAVSPSLPAMPPLVIRTARSSPGSIHVHLIGTDGRSMRGAVTISLSPPGPTFMGASADRNGNIVFPSMPSGSYTLRANIYNQPPAPPLGQGNDPWPSESALSDVREVLPEKITVSADSETSVTLHEQRTGYVTGYILGSPDIAGQCSVMFSSDNTSIFDPNAPSISRVASATGEYVVGPIPPGPAQISVHWFSHNSSGASPRQWIRSFSITIPTKGGVMHLNLIAPTQADQVPDLSNQAIAGTVYLSDGKTPAWGASAVVLQPNSSEPTQWARANALGQLTPSEGEFIIFPQNAMPPGGVTRPTLVVWLPGTTGAVVMPYDPAANPQIILPPAQTLVGHVTVAEQSPVGLLSAFEIEAEPVDHGQLNNLFAVTVTAQADGTFTLPILLPGTYRVQAARDRLWLSAAQVVVVSATGLLAPLTLDIPQIGQSTPLRLQDSEGRPLPLFSAMLPQSPGPLAARYWPKTVTTDGAGDIVLPGLTAGPHELEIPSSPQNGQTLSVAFMVPPLGAPAPVVQTLTVP